MEGGIQGTFGGIQGTFGGIQGTSGRIQGTFGGVQRNSLPSFLTLFTQYYVYVRYHTSYDFMII
jgi:hypothetical protein